MSDNIRIIVQKPASPIIKIAPEGTDGIGIASIELISTVGLVKTYRINYTNGNHFDYEVTDGSDANCVWGNITGALSDQTDLKNALDAKADADDVYSKTDTDMLLSGKADASDVYTKSETDDLLDLKANAADVYTQAELDGIFDGIDNALDTKADASDVYTKTQTDNKLADKADADDVYTKAETDALLGDKADADDVYTKSETDTLLSAKANTADLGSLADQDTVDYQTEVTNKPTLGALAGMDSIDYTSNKLTNKPTLGSLADQDTVDYVTEVTNKPTLGTMSAESASDYYNKTATDALLDAKLTAHDGTLSGSVLSFNAESTHAVKALSVAIEPVQSGSGDPAPDNVRPITGWTSAHIYLEDEYDADADPTITIDLNGTIYGGTLNVLTGVLTVNKQILQIDPTWNMGQSATSNPNGTVFVINQSVPYEGWQDYRFGISNMFVMGNGTQATSPANSFWWTSNSSGIRVVYGLPNNGTTTEEFRQFLTDNPTYICGPLAAPLTVQLTANQMPSSFLGQNALWCDTGDSTALIQLVTGNLAYRDALVDNVTDGILTIR